MHNCRDFDFQALPLFSVQHWKAGPWAWILGYTGMAVFSPVYFRHVGFTLQAFSTDFSLGKRPKALMWPQATPKLHPPIMPGIILGENTGMVSPRFGIGCRTTEYLLQLSIYLFDRKGEHSFSSLRSIHYHLGVAQCPGINGWGKVPLDIGLYIIEGVRLGGTHLSQQTKD